MKLYRRHYCSASHQSFLTLAKCIWRRAVWITGEGPFALLARCPSGPTERRQALTVTLWPTLRDAEVQKAFIDRMGCGGRCWGDHQIIKLAAVAAWLRS
jgi:hypothetical protein